MRKSRRIRLARHLHSRLRMSVNKKLPVDRSSLPIIGWREWIGLPELAIDRIKVKVDTGARSSALHAFDLHEFERGGERWVRFKVHPIQRDSKTTRQTEAPVLEYRSVKNSSGRASLRPVIVTSVKFLDQTWQIELTLTNRDQMGFRMLLGREAIRNRFLVDSGKSYFGGKPKKKKTQTSRPGS